MENSRVWWRWTGSFIFNTLLAVSVAVLSNFPLWAVIVFIVVMDGLVVMWRLGVITPSLYVTNDLVMGIWVVMQMVMYIAVFAEYFVPLIIYSSLPVLIVVILVAVLVFTGAFLMYLRTTDARNLLS